MKLSGFEKFEEIVGFELMCFVGFPQTWCLGLRTGLINPIGEIEPLDLEAMVVRSRADSLGVCISTLGVRKSRNKRAPGIKHSRCSVG